MFQNRDLWDWKGFERARSKNHITDFEEYLSMRCLLVFRFIEFDC